MSDRQKVTGGCMCGNVRYEAIGEPLHIGYCHCHSCRHHTGAPAVAVVVFETIGSPATTSLRGAGIVGANVSALGESRRGQ